MSNNKLDKKKKNYVRNGVVVLLTILGLVVVFIGIKKVYSDNKYYKEGSVEFSNSELKKYVDYIKPANYDSLALLYDTESVSAKKLSSDDKIRYIGAYLSDMRIFSDDYKHVMLLEEDVKNSLENVYGLGTYERVQFNLGCSDYIFNESDGKYYSRVGCGDAITQIVSNEVVSYIGTKNKLEITTAYVFFDVGKNKIYKDFKEKDALDNYKYSNEKDIETYLKKYIKKNKKKLNNIVYTFESDDGKNYYFKKFVNNRE